MIKLYSDKSIYNKNKNYIYIYINLYLIKNFPKKIKKKNKLFFIFDNMIE